jgi:lipopolysaccharide export system protein LptC
MAVELHLPDLPEVPLSLRPPLASGRARTPWPVRLSDALSAYLPLLLMLVLALGTWWLVKNTPVPAAPAKATSARTEPDYTMREFTMERFRADGQLKLRLQGSQLHHYPDTNRVEVLGARITAFAPDGRVTTATADRALGNGDGSEMQLSGNAQVVGTDPRGAPLIIRSEYLLVQLVTERLQTHLPVWVQQGPTELKAAGLEYDHASQRLDLKGPLRAVLASRGSAAPSAVAVAVAAPASTAAAASKTASARASASATTP